MSKSAFWRLLLPFIAGIVMQYYLRIPFLEKEAWLVIATLFCLCCVSVFLKQYALRWLFGAFLVCFSLFVGAVLTASSLQESSWELPEEIGTYRLQLLDDPVEKPKSRMCQAEIVGSEEGLFHLVAGKKVIVYFSKDQESKELKAGDGVVVATKFKKPEPIPGSSFDYAEYLEKKGFAAVGYVARGQWQLQQAQASFLDNLKFKALDCRRYIIEVLKKIIPDEKNAGMGEALFIGYKADLDTALQMAFSSTGAAHILAVSGLHLAILFGILCFIFSPLDRFGKFQSVLRLFILLVLWFFTFTTGLSPSIVRACIMTTFIGMGTVLNKRSITMNTLAASALFMLLYDPLYLFDVGFQLSYAAVISIVLINPHIVRLMEFKSRISSYFWELTSVSVSAQLGTTPISLLYFQQFPLVFILTNMFAIPLSGLLMLLLPLGVLLRMIYSFPDFVFYPLNATLSFFISGIEMLSAIPFSVLRGLSIDIWDVCGLYIGLFLVMMLLLKKRLVYLYLFFLLVALQVFYYL